MYRWLIKYKLRQLNKMVGLQHLSPLIISWIVGRSWVSYHNKTLYWTLDVIRYGTRVVMEHQDFGEVECVSSVRNPSDWNKRAGILGQDSFVENTVYRYKDNNHLDCV